MFERNSMGSQDQHQLILVHLTQDDGNQMQGQILVPIQGGLSAALNGTKRFLEFSTFDGEIHYIAIGSISQATQIDVPETDQLSVRDAQARSFNPYHVLGVHKGASFQDVQMAYHKKAKQYHPDKFAQITLPVEVEAYLAAQAKRVNVAFDQLQAQMTAQA